MTVNSSQTSSSYTKRSPLALGSSILLVLGALFWLAFGVNSPNFNVFSIAQRLLFSPISVEIRALFSFALFIFIIVSSIVAAWSCWFQKPWAIYAQLFALFTQMQFVTSLINFRELTFFIPFPIVGLSVSLISFGLTTFRRNVKPLVVASIVGLSITISSVIYPPSYPRLRAGFPLPYFVDIIGISVMGKLGLEDFEPLLFMLDLCFYTLLAYSGIKRLQNYQDKKRLDE